MEHLVRNTYNEEKVLILQNIDRQHQINVQNNLEKLVENTVNIGVVILSSIISGIIVTIFSNNINSYFYNNDSCVSNNSNSSIIVPWISVIVLILLMVAINFIYHKFLKKILKNFSEDNLVQEKPKNIEKVLNTEIIQKIAVVNESVALAETAKDKDCCVLNLVMALYNLDKIINFFDENVLTSENKDIRKYSNRPLALKAFSMDINIYLIAIIVRCMDNANSKISQLIKDSYCQQIKGYDLLIKDQRWISEKIETLKEYINEA